MKRLMVISALVAVAGTVKAQQPAHWSVQTKQLDDGDYQVILTANLDEGWHIYSQNQPADAIAAPTSLSFTKNPLLVFVGTPREEGQLIQAQNETLGITQNQYNDKVSFVQLIHPKGSVTTRLEAKVHYQVCTDEMCLPPTDEALNVMLPPAIVTKK